jgi:hypothetical protein
VHISTRIRHLSRDRELQQTAVSSVNLPASTSASTPLDVPLFEGSETSLRTAVTKKLLVFIGNNGMSKKALSQMLQTESIASKLPRNYRSLINLIKPELMPLKRHDVCHNECVMYRYYDEDRDYSHLTKCPVCNEARIRNGKRKSFVYIPLKERLQRWFGETSLAKLIYSGNRTMDSDLPEELNDFQDGTEFCSWFSHGGMFSDCPRGAIPLGLFTDGLNPNRNQLISYSMWPILLTWWSLPPQFRTLLGPMFLYGIIPGQDNRMEPKSLEPYMELLVDEILSLEGKDFFHSYLNAPIPVKVRLVYFYCDIPAYSKLLHLMGQQALRSCPYCDSEAVYCNHLNKPVHLGNRRFLPPDDPLRRATGFPEETELRPKPQKIIGIQERMERQRYETLPNQSQKRKHAKSTGSKGQYAFMRLPHHDRPSQMSPDGMHTLADLVCNILETITGKSDSYKVRKCEQSHGRFSSTWVTNPANKLPPAPWALNNAQKVEADKRMRNLKLPSYLELRHRPYFTKPWQLDRMHTKLQVSLDSIYMFTYVYIILLGY